MSLKQSIKKTLPPYHKVATNYDLIEPIENRATLSNTTSKRYLMHVLAVDDNSANLKLLCALLDGLVLYTAFASNGRKAVEFANKQPFDLIFMDIQMPELDGIETRKQLEQSELNSLTPVIAVTANAVSGTKERLIAEGFSDYLSKPIDEITLIDKIEKWAPKALINQNIDKPFTQSINYNHIENAIKNLSPLSELNNKEHHFNPKFALKQSMEKSDLAQELLSLLLITCSETEIIIKKSLASLENSEPQLDKNLHDELSKQIHKLHGGCSYCGVPHMQNLCLQLENLLLTQELSDLEPELLELLDEISYIKTITDNFSFDSVDSD